MSEENMTGVASGGVETALGQSTLPLSRIKKIIKLDEDIRNCTNSSAFLVSVATEMFVQYLAKNGFKGALKDKRKTLQYKDLANVVSHLDNLEFLSDLVPKTVPYKKIVERKKATQERETGQLTLREQRLPGKKVNGHVANGKVAKPGSSRASSSNSRTSSPNRLFAEDTSAEKPQQGQKDDAMEE